MSEYTPPLQDIRFTMEHVAGLGDIVATERFAHAEPDTLFDVLAEVGRLMSDVVAPTNRDGDTIGARWNPDGSVTLPESFHSAYSKWVESGYNAMPFDPDYGGADFPWLSAIAVQEMLGAANMSLSLCPLLTQGAIDAIHAHGTDEQKSVYLPKMLTGEWAGTMNLTEPQAGSDVGAVATKAEPCADASARWGAGAYRITGQKIYITYGEHELHREHRPPRARPHAGFGTGHEGDLDVRRAEVPRRSRRQPRRPQQRGVRVDRAQGRHPRLSRPVCWPTRTRSGWLVGGEHDGMRNMFTMMNNARLSVGLQGLALGERAYQQALGYAQERVQGRAIGAPSGTSSPIIDHPDVRRMLMHQRAWIDALRALIYTNAGALDLATAARSAGDADSATRWQELADLLIPISKALGTDVGVELTSLAVQVYGGMGYVEESGVAQHFRDVRIAPIYEGTNGIQAADLVGRKLAMRGGEVVGDLLAEFDVQADELAKVDGFVTGAGYLHDATAVARRATAHLLDIAATDPRRCLRRPPRICACSARRCAAGSWPRRRWRQRIRRSASIPNTQRPSQRLRATSSSRCSPPLRGCWPRSKRRLTCSTR